ncbi:MAG: hypothetical protein C0402_06840 [Thermodesulfovibrio sp.]|nr:hypothetical protein [Thermodesulfovibrio sp.]
MLKIRHTGGEKVSKGNYWNVTNGQRVIVSKEETLPGDRTATYYKASPLLVLAAGPALGLLYAAFLPFIGIAMVMQLALTKIFAVTIGEMSKVSTFNWSPAASFLAGRKHRNKKAAEEKTEEQPEEKKEPGS